MGLRFPRLAIMTSGEGLAKLTKARAAMQSQGTQMMFLPFLVFFCLAFECLLLSVAMLKHLVNQLKDCIWLNLLIAGHH